MLEHLFLIVEFEPEFEFCLNLLKNESHFFSLPFLSMLAARPSWRSWAGPP
jgi:hypothetical protein